jgi:hypothetical protein
MGPADSDLNSLKTLQDKVEWDYTV